MNNKPIGVFDSGVGGISVLKELYMLMPNENYIYYGDSKNAPYGTKSDEEIEKLTRCAIQKLTDMNVKAVVIACNTATSVAAGKLRDTLSIPVMAISFWWISPKKEKPTPVNDTFEVVYLKPSP